MAQEKTHADRLEQILSQDYQERKCAHKFLALSLLLVGLSIVPAFTSQAESQKDKTSIAPENTDITGIPEQGPLGRDPTSSPGQADHRDPLRNVMPYKTALVLGGGGSKGAFQVGVLKYLYERRNFDPIIITGTSVGARNAAKLAEGPDAITELVRLWRGIKGDSDVYIGSQEVRNLVDQINTMKEEMKSEIKDGLIGGVLLSIPLTPLGGIWTGGAMIGAPNLDELLPYVNRIKGLKDQQPLIDIINANLSESRIANSGIKLRVASVARDTGKLRYINERGDLESPDGTLLERGPFSGGRRGAVSVRQGVIASAAIPVGAD